MLLPVNVLESVYLLLLHSTQIIFIVCKKAALSNLTDRLFGEEFFVDVNIDHECVSKTLELNDLEKRRKPYGVYHQADACICEEARNDC